MMQYKIKKLIKLALLKVRNNPNTMITPILELLMKAIEECLVIKKEGKNEYRKNKFNEKFR